MMTEEQKAARRRYKAAWARKAYAENPQRHRENVRRFRQRHLEKQRAKDREEYRRNVEQRRLKSLLYYQQNKERQRASNRAYCVREKARCAERKRIEAARNRQRRNSAYFANLLRNSLRDALRGKIKKSCSALKLLGCPLDLFKLHLQSQFRDGMAWNNHGTVWHIDHIQPCSSFDLTEPAQQALCFHYGNMQPLLVSENLKKGDKVIA